MPILKENGIGQTEVTTWPWSYDLYSNYTLTPSVNVTTVDFMSAISDLWDWKTKYHSVTKPISVGISVPESCSNFLGKLQYRINIVDGLDDQT